MGPAGANDVVSLVRLRDEAAVWQQSAGLQQWRPGEVPVEWFASQVAAGEWFVVREAGEVIAALRLLWQDEGIWGPRPADSAYVHGLVISRQRAGQGLGAELLSWAEDEAGAAGRRWMRLDCVESNRRLRRYYEQQGYSVVGRKTFATHWSPVVLLAKRLRRTPPGP